jgi:hypothetical protein
MTFNIENIKLLRNTREVAVLKRPLDDESLASKYLTLNLKFLAGLINRTIVLRQKYPGGKTIILGRRES